MSDSLDLAATLIARPDFEGLRLRPYRCPAGDWTIGIGSRTLADGTPVQADTPAITATAAVALARRWLASLQDKLRQRVGVPLSRPEEAALLSLQYNIGTSALAGSTLLRHLNRGYYASAAYHFLDWDKAHVGGVLTTLPGLVKRRRIERSVFLGLLTITPEGGPVSASPAAGA